MKKNTLLPFFEVLPSKINFCILPKNTISRLGFCWPNLSHSAKIALMFFFFLTSINLFAQVVLPPSDIYCPSKDLEVTGAKLPAPANDLCSCSGTRTLQLGIINKTGSDRTSFAMWGNLIRKDASGKVIGEPVAIFACASGIDKLSTKFYTTSTTIDVRCNESIDIIDVILAWTSSNNKETCEVLRNNPSTINPKCGRVDAIRVETGVDASANVVNATCTSNGSIQVFPFGGIAPYKVKIGNDERTGISTGESVTFSLPAQEYSILVTDSRACSSTRSRTIESSSAPTVSAGDAFTKTCTSNTTGKSIGEPNDPTATYLWSPTDGLSSSTASNPTANPVLTTTYTVTKTTTANGCTAQATVLVTVNTTVPSITGIGGAFEKTCTSNTLGAVIGETPVPGFSYGWSPSTGLSDAAIGNPTANPTTTTTYTVTKTNTTNGCSAQASVVVTVNTTVPSVTGIGGAFTKTCTSNASGAAIGEDAVQGFSYAWSPSTGLSDAAIGNPTASPTSTTTYTVTKTNTTNGCSAQASVVVTVNTTVPSVTGIGGAFTKTCTSNASGAVIGETPLPGFSYAWSPSTGLSNAAIGNPTANPSSTTTYTVTKTSTANGCTSQASVVVTVNAATPNAPTFCAVQPSLCGSSGSVTILSPLGADYTYSIDGKTWQTSTVFNDLGAGSVSGIRVKNTSSGCISDPAYCEASSCQSPAKIASPEVKKTSSIIVPAEETTSTNTTETAGFDAYPVPFKDQLTVKYNFDYVSDVKIEVFDAQGISVLTKSDGNSYLNKEITLELQANKDQGQVYVVKVTTNRGSSIKKVMSSR